MLENGALGMADAWSEWQIVAPRAAEARRILRRRRVRARRARYGAIAGDRPSRRARESLRVKSVCATSNRIGPDVPSKTSLMIRLDLCRSPPTLTTDPFCMEYIIDGVRRAGIVQGGARRPYFRVSGRVVARATSA